MRGWVLWPTRGRSNTGPGLGSGQSRNGRRRRLAGRDGAGGYIGAPRCTQRRSRVLRGSGSPVRWSAVATSASLRRTELDPVTVRVQRRDTDAERVVLGLRLHELDPPRPEHFELLAQIVRLEEYRTRQNARPRRIDRRAGLARVARPEDNLARRMGRRPRRE